MQLKHKKAIIFASYFSFVKWYHYNNNQLLSQEAIKINYNSKYFHNSSQIVSSYIVIGDIIIYQYFIITIYLGKRTSSKRIDLPERTLKLPPNQRSSSLEKKVVETMTNLSTCHIQTGSIQLQPVVSIQQCRPRFARVSHFLRAK